MFDRGIIVKKGFPKSETEQSKRTIGLLASYLIESVGAPLRKDLSNSTYPLLDRRVMSNENRVIQHKTVSQSISVQD